MVLINANSPDPSYKGVDGARYKRGRNRPVDRIRKQVFEAETDNPFRAFNYLRSLVKTTMHNLEGCKLVLPDESIETVEVMYARPERAVAKMKDSRNLKLPIMSFDIANIQPSEARYRPNTNLEYWTIKNIANQRAMRVAGMAPRAVDLEANIHIWAKTNFDMYQIMEWVMLQFHPHMRIATDLNAYTHAFIDSVSDESVVDLGDRDDRVIRKTISLKIEGYIPTRKYAIQSNGDIEEFNFRIVFIDEATEETLYRDGVIDEEGNLTDGFMLSPGGAYLVGPGGAYLVGPGI